MAPLKRRVWVTRSAPGAARTAERLRAAGFTPLVDPLLEARDLGEGPIELAGVAALAFTSAAAVAAFARRSPARALPAYAVGEATARAAREAGFADVRAGASDVAALARQIAGALERGGIPARRRVVYETALRRPARATLAALPSLAAILLHSPKAARALAALVSEIPSPSPLAGGGGERSEPDEGSRGVSELANTGSAGRSRPLIRPFGPPSPARGEGKTSFGVPRILCLSPAIAKALTEFVDRPPPFDIRAAADPTDEALIALLRATLG